MTGYGYGVWLLVVVNSAIFIIFAASFFHPRSMRDWKAMGAFSSFVVALNGRDVRLSAHHLLLVGMARYFLSGWLGSRFDTLTLTHNGGHLWSELLGWQGDPHLSPFHLVSYVFIGAGFWAIAAAWPVLLRAARDGELATTGLYARVRHPQYVGFLVIMVGFLLQWPTIPTLVMFPVLIVIYRRLSLQEERAVAAEFGTDWEDYARRTPRFIPRLRTHQGADRPNTIETLERTESQPGGNP